MYDHCFLTISNKPYTKTTQAKNQERERKIFCGEGEWRFVGIEANKELQDQIFLHPKSITWNYVSSMYFTGKAQTIANETQNCKINILFNTYILTSLSAKFKQMKKNEGFYARREHINNRQMQSK